MTADPAEAILNGTQLNDIEALLKGLSREQLLWLSGYLAALGKGQFQQSQQTDEEHKALIAYGTETGNCQGIASALAFSFEQHKIPFTLKNLSQLRAKHLVKYQFVVLICSTHGDGDPPEPISLFYTSIMASNAPRLTGTQYAVLALGDSSYPKFCATGRGIDDRLSALGAGRLMFRRDCDVDYTETSKEWNEEVSRILSTKFKDPANHKTSKIESCKTLELNKNNPVETEVIENILLSNESRTDAIHHIELSCDKRLRSIEPGDAVGILIRNSFQHARELVKMIGAHEGAVVQINHRNITLLQALIEECDITVPSKRLLTEWGKVTKNKFLDTILSDEGGATKEFLRTHQVRDLAEKFPVKIDAQIFVQALKPLQPRLYDVANSMAFAEDEIHILLKRYSYSFNGRLSNGIASDYLANLVSGDQVRLFPYRNAKFHLPADKEAPVIFIAEGTGISPFRAFLQEKSIEENPSSNWLIFFERDFEEDFLYQSEWQNAVDNGLLESIDAIFTNQTDQSFTKLIAEKREYFLSLLDKGAHLYLCGDKDCFTNIEKQLETFTQGSSFSWTGLQAASRVHRNLY